MIYIGFDAYREAVNWPIAVPNSASVTRSPTGSIRMIASMHSSCSDTSNGSRSFFPSARYQILTVTSTLPSLGSLDTLQLFFLTICERSTTQLSRTKSTFILGTLVSSHWAVVIQGGAVVRWRIWTKNSGWPLIEQEEQVEVFLVPHQWRSQAGLCSERISSSPLLQPWAGGHIFLRRISLVQGLLIAWGLLIARGQVYLIRKRPPSSGCL